MPCDLGLLSRPAFILGLIRDEPTVDQYLRILPWLRLMGDKVRVPTSSLQNWGSAYWLGSGDAVQSSLSCPDDQPAEYVLGRALAELALYTYCDEIYSGPQDVDVLQVQADCKVRAIQELIGSAAIYGVGPSSDQPFGLISMAVGGQKITADDDNPDGGPMSLSDLDRLVRLIKAEEGQRICLVMNRTVLQIWKSLVYQTGAIPQVGFCPYLGIETYLHGIAYLIVCDFILNNETEGAGTNRSSVYAVLPDPKNGVYGIFKPGRCGGFVQVSERTNQNDECDYRFSANVGFACARPTSVARAAGVATT